MVKGYEETSCGQSGFKICGIVGRKKVVKMKGKLIMVEWRRN